MNRQSRLAARLSLLAALSMAGGSLSSAQSNWVDWTDETATRLQLSVVSLSDTQEKDITLGDLDQDGDEDLVIVRKVPFSVIGGQLNVLLMNEGGVLVDRTEVLCPAFMASSDTRDVLLFDANGDGWIDMVTATTFGEPPRLFINQGLDGGGVFLGFIEDTSWFSPAFFPGPQFCAVYDGDIDNDGDLDLYFSDYDNFLEDRLLINDGTGKFTDETSVRFPTGINNSVFGTGSFICDFTMDGWNDILKVSGSFEPMKLLINDGTGVFTQSQTLESSTVYMARARDFNNDGRTDIYTVSDTQDYVLMNDSTNGSGTIATTRVDNTSSNKTAGFGGNVHAADLDRDGFLDMGVADVDVDIPGCTRRFAALRSKLPAASGFMDPNNPTNLPWNAQGVHDFAWIDIDGDGFKDLFQARCTGYAVYIMNPFAVAESYGEGCEGTLGKPVVGSNGGAPTLGNTSFELTLDNANPGAASILMVSIDPTSRIITGELCELLSVSPSLFLFNNGLTDPSGHLDRPLPIPNDITLEGVRVFMQFLVIDSNGAIENLLSASDGMELYLSNVTLP